MPIEPLIQRFVDDELARAPALVSRVLAGTLQLLGPSKDGTLSATERSHHAELVRALQRDADHYERAFLESLRRQVRDELGPDDDAGAAESRGHPTLELMDETRVEVDIEISRAMQLIDTTAEWELRELQTFTSTLLGERHVRAESNPMRPLLYATALWDAACAVASSQTQRAIVLRTSAGVAAGLLKNAWAAASTRLEQQGVEPGVYRTVVLPSGTTFARAGTPEVSRTHALAQLLASMPGTAYAAATPGAPAGSPVRSDGASRRNPELEAALLRLDALLRQLPADASFSGRATTEGKRFQAHRDALVASAADPLDRQVIELVTRLFEALLGDSQLPAAFRPVFARLQTPVLRVCLADAAVLDAYDHAVWRLLDRIGETAIGYSRVDDARLVSFLQFADAVSHEMAGGASPDAALFRRGLQRVETFLAEQFQEQLQAAQPTLDALQVAERREILQQHLTQRLTDQMVPIRTSPAIRRFVTGAWAQVIAENMLRHGEHSEATLSDLKTVDDLLWSLKIPDHPQSRQRLLQLLPGLLQRLRVGMELVSLAAAERQVVLNELMTLHTEALRPGTRGPGGGALTPEEIVQRMRDEVVPDSPSARHFSDSVIDLSSMETVPAEHLPSGGDASGDDPTRRIEALRGGDRVRVFLEGRWGRVQLLWRSDRSLFFLFAGESPARRHSITRRALERLASAGLVQPLEAKAIVPRAVDRMMRELGGRA